LLYASKGRRDEAAESYEVALSILDGLRRIEAAEASHAILAGGVWCNLGHLQSANHDGEAAGASYERAEEILREALLLSPGDETAASYLFNTLTGRIEVRANRGDFEGAVEVCEEAVRSAPPGYEASLRLRLAYFSAKSGDHERAAAELEALAGEVQFDAAARLNVAQTWALCAAAVGEGDRDAYERYVAKAVAAIGECLEAGIAKAEEIEAEGDFAVIREEPGFRGVVEGNRER
jgi:tetratricopeptide (TPR) repeat protein